MFDGSVIYNFSGRPLPYLTGWFSRIRSHFSTDGIQAFTSTNNISANEQLRRTHGAMQPKMVMVQIYEINYCNGLINLFGETSG